MPGDIPGATMPELIRLPCNRPRPPTVPKLVSVPLLGPLLTGVPRLSTDVAATISSTPLLVLKFCSTSSPSRIDTLPVF